MSAGNSEQELSPPNRNGDILPRTRVLGSDMRQMRAFHDALYYQTSDDIPRRTATPGEPLQRHDSITGRSSSALPNYAVAPPTRSLNATFSDIVRSHAALATLCQLLIRDGASSRVCNDADTFVHEITNRLARPEQAAQPVVSRIHDSINIDYTGVELRIAEALSKDNPVKAALLPAAEVKPVRGKRRIEL